MGSNGRSILAALGRKAMLAAQDGLCPLCGTKLRDGLPPLHPRAVTVEHVWPKKLGFPGTSHKGNAILTHFECNNAKDDRLPKPCEVLFLFAVNRRLGYSEAETIRWDQPSGLTLPDRYIRLEELARG